MEEPRLFEATVARIVDGDTLYVDVDLSFRVYTRVSIRILGIDAPELFSGDERDLGRTAKEYLDSIAPPGAPVTLRTYKDRRSFNRYVASILLADGTDVGSEMVHAGHATWSEPP